MTARRILLLFSACASAFLLQTAPAVAWWPSLEAGRDAAQAERQQGQIEVAFSPNGGAADLVCRAVNNAKSQILVAAYSFTNRAIAKALAEAKARGVDVRAVLDKSQQTERYSSATFLAHSGIPVRIDSCYAIMHDKTMVIDGINVVTGSFNFTEAAEAKNAENVLCIKGNPTLAQIYGQVWERLWEESQPYVDVGRGAEAARSSGYAWPRFRRY